MIEDSFGTWFPILLLVIAVIVGSLLISYLYYKNRLKHYGKQCIMAVEEFAALCVPTRSFSNEEVLQFLDKYKTLAFKIEKAVKYKWFTVGDKDSYPADKFLKCYNEIHIYQTENNRLYGFVDYVNKNYSRLFREQTSLHFLYHSHHVIEKYNSHCLEFLRAVSQLNRHNALRYVDQPNYVSHFAYYHNTLIDKDNIVRHNEQYVELQKQQNQSFFDTCLKYPLDLQQREAILHLEDNTLVISSAGSGKTSTMVGKARYMVEKEGIDPSKILLITYTRKAAGELSERLGIENLSCSTFHAIALKVIADLTGEKPTVCDPGFMLNSFYSLIRDNVNFKAAINRYITKERSLMKLPHDYVTAEDFYADRKKYGIQPIFPDMQGNIIFTKSEEEKRICEWLTLHNVSFLYEQEYEHKTSENKYRQYKPDFSIYYSDRFGVKRRIYLEHFAIDKDGKVPLWFGSDYNAPAQDDEAIVSRWEQANSRYNSDIIWKKNLHSNYKTTLIFTTSAMFHDKTVWDMLERQLVSYGVPVQNLTPEQLYEKLVHRDKGLERSIFKLLEQFTTLQKANMVDVDELIHKAKENNDSRSEFIISDIMKPFILYYNQELRNSHQIDFTDAILQATQLANTGKWSDYDYILVDEFQDISKDRYLFLKALRKDTEKCFTKLFCVGDDWQSIYRFSGSDMSLFYDFENYFGFTKHCKIETTYRFHEPLIELSSKFIQENPFQVKKQIKGFVSEKQIQMEAQRDILLDQISSPGLSADAESELQQSMAECDEVLTKFETNISYHSYLSDLDEQLKVQRLIASIPSSEDILIIARYNYDAKSLGYNFAPQDADKKVIYLNLAGRRIRFMSVHGAKGLEADHVILINCNSGIHGFPSLIEDDPILSFVLSDKDQYENAEERRVFYVAITRAKKHMYVFYDEKNPSCFVEEMTARDKESNSDYIPCPTCGQGEIYPVKEGTHPNYGDWITLACTDRAGGCRYFRTMGKNEYTNMVNDFNARNSVFSVQDNAKNMYRQIRSCIQRVNQRREEQKAKLIVRVWSLDEFSNSNGPFRSKKEKVGGAIHHYLSFEKNGREIIVEHSPYLGVSSVTKIKAKKSNLQVALCGNGTYRLIHQDEEVTK